MYRESEETIFDSRRPCAHLPCRPNVNIHTWPLPFMVTRSKGRSSDHAAGGDDIIFVDGERIEIAGTYPDMEAAIEALHKGE